jgi:polyphosphate glucokinase
MNVLVVDVGGTNVKILATGQDQHRRFASGPKMTPAQMVAGVKELAGDWKYEVIAMGYPGRVILGRVMAEPHNLAPGWIGFDSAAAFGCPVQVMNDAAMQALGSYQGSGLLLFLGLGTGLGSALVTDGVIVPMELGHLSYRETTFEDYIGAQGLQRLGLEEWQRHIRFVTARLIDALCPDDVVLGGGNAKKLTEVPPGCRLGDNAHAFLGGFKMWEERKV